MGRFAPVVLLPGHWCGPGGWPGGRHRRLGRAPPGTAAAPTSAAAPWLILALAACAWELQAYLRQPRYDHPTLSSLANAPLDSHPELEGADAIVHLNGRRVDTRATRRNVDELISSRVEPVRAVGQGLLACEAPPPTWVQSSSLAIFGEGGDQIIDEFTTPSGIGPPEMVTVCLAWEAAFAQAAAEVDRAVLLRMGIGLGGDGDPATKKLAQIVRLGLGGKVGSGRQWVSWIGLDDLLDVMLRAIDDPGMRGTYHVTSPNPVTNAEMMATYRRLLGRRLGLPTPAVVAKLGAPAPREQRHLALTGRRCVPTRLLDEGFEFQQPDFEATARQALQRCGAL